MTSSRHHSGSIALVTAGAVMISFAAVFVRLADVAPTNAAPANKAPTKEAPTHTALPKAALVEAAPAHAAQASLAHQLIDATPAC